MPTSAIKQFIDEKKSIEGGRPEEARRADIRQSGWTITMYREAFGLHAGYRFALPAYGRPKVYLSLQVKAFQCRSAKAVRPYADNPWFIPPYRVGRKRHAMPTSAIKDVVDDKKINRRV